METYSKQRRFVSNEDDWDLRNGTLFTFEPQYRSIENHALPKLMHHYMLQYMNGKFYICKKCVNNCFIQKGIIEKAVL